MTKPNIHTSRLAGLFVLATLVLSLPAVCARAADSERPFNPPVGSRWIVETEINGEEIRPEGKRNSLIRSRAEMTIEASLSDGFRVVYVRRGITAEGNDPSLPLLRAGMQALVDVPIRATTDKRGKPVRVDNLEEAKAAMRSVAGKMTAPFKDKPQVVAVLQQMMARLTEADAARAATDYLDELPELAKAQGTGMKPGEVRRSTEMIENPLGGGAIRSNAGFELKEADAATGRRVFVNTTTYDPAAIKELTQSLGKKLMATGGSSVTPAQIDNILKQMELSLDERSIFEVENGMTRKLTEKSVMTVRALGHNLQKTETKTITVAPAP